MTAPEPPSFRILNAEGAAPLVLICDHASRAVPPALGNLGLPDAELARHIGWDPGAAAVTERLAQTLDAPAVLAGVSRLVIDCNRRPDDPTLICEISDGTLVPGNRDLDAAERARRLETYFRPYHGAVAATLAAVQARHPQSALLSVHSFTPQLRAHEEDRPWHVGVVWDADGRLALPLLEALRAEGDLIVGDNEPYSGRRHAGYSIFAHGQDQGRHHVMVEIRQDLIADAAGVADWAARLDRCFRHMLLAAGLHLAAANAA